VDADRDGALIVGSDSVCLTLQGDIDVNSAEHYRQAVSDVIAQRSTKILVDLSDVPFMDSSGLGLLADLARASRDWEGSVYVLDAAEIVQTAVRACGLDQYVALVDSDDPRLGDVPVEGAGSAN
jgi:anti-sigma B factor antagonist